MNLTGDDPAETTLGGLWLTGRTGELLPGRNETPFDHQLKTKEAIERGADAVVNTNPTGAGKTRAWVAPTLRASTSTGDGFVIAVYPTNALLRDQASTIRELVLDYFRHDTDARVESGDDGDRLGDPDDGDGLGEDDNGDGSDDNGDEPIIHRGGESVPVSKLVRPISGGETTGSTGVALTNASESSDRLSRAGLPLFVLTTPDTFTLAGLERFYDNDVGGVPTLADRIVVDEFHLAAPRGRRLLPFVLGLYHRLARDPPQFVFLSATPRMALDRLERVFDTTTVNRPLSTEPSADTVAQILPTARLSVESCELFRAGDHLADAAADLLAWATDDQLLVIVDSVREVETVYQALVEEADDREIGRLYGWKREGRQAVVETADVVVGNTAMEVGVDFDRVSRVVATAHDAAGAIQRIGRMRHRAAVDDYEIVLLAPASVKSAVLRADDPLERPELEQILFENLDPLTAAPFYDVLLAAATYYFFHETELGAVIHDDRKQLYRDLAADCFAPGVETLYDELDNDPDTVWAEGRGLVEELGADGQPLFEELGQYRSSSITVAVLDETDDTERIKTTALGSLLRNRECTILDDRAHLEARYETVFGPVTDADAARLDDVSSYVVGYARANGFREEPGTYGLSNTGFRWEQEAKRDNDNWYEPVPEPVSTRVEGPSGTCASRLDVDDVLCYALEESATAARAKHRLGPYANVVGRDTDAIALWDDALLAYARDVSDTIM